MNRDPQNETTSGEVVFPATPMEEYPDWMQHSPRERQKKEYPVTVLHQIFGWLSILMSFLLVRALPKGEHPLGNLLITLLFFALGTVFLLLSGRKLRPRHWVFLSASAVFSVAYVTNANGAILFFVGVLLTVAFCAILYDGFGAAGERLRAYRIPAHLRMAVLKYPFASLGAIFSALANTGKGRAKGLWKTVLMVGIGLLAAVIPTALIWGLLSYDDGFDAIMNRLFSFSMDGFWENLGDLLLSFPVAVLLFSLLYTASQRGESGEEQIEAARGLHRVPKVVLCTAVTPILLLYVVFFVSQWSYYVSAFTHILPEGLTYAAYAREGFFQLCTVCGINAAILLFFHLLVLRREDGGHSVVTKAYFSVISLFTLILIATALSKMILYINSYGLTQKRVYASWFMLLLALIFVCVLIGQVIRRFPAMAMGLIGAVVLFGLIAVPNVDAMIADYNVSAYLSGDLKQVDVVALQDLELSSIPARVRLEKELKEKTDRSFEEDRALEAVTYTLDHSAKLIENEKNDGKWGFFSGSIPRLLAERALNSR